MKLPRTIVAAAGMVIAVGAVILGIQWWHVRRYAVPDSIQTYAQFVGAMPRAAEFAILTIHEHKFLQVTGAMPSGFTQAVTLPSGPAQYIFDADGFLVDWTLDLGDDPDFVAKWQPSKRQIMSATNPWERFSCERLDAALSEDRIVISFFMASWDRACRSLERYFHEPDFRVLLSWHNVEALWVDLTDLDISDRGDERRQLLDALGILDRSDRGVIPAVAIFSGHHNVEVHQGDTISPEDVLDSLRAAIQDET